MQLPNTHSTSPANTWFIDNLAEIQSRSRACFARLNPELRDDAVAEVMSHVFTTSVSAARRGVLAKITPYHAVVFAAKHYRKGRRIAGYSTTDVMSEGTRIKGRAKVVSFESFEAHSDVPLSETLADKHADQRPYEQARVNIDYRTIFKREKISKKARQVFRLLAGNRSHGHVTDIAHALQVTPGRVCQLKNELARVLAKYGYSPIPPATTDQA